MDQEAALLIALRTGFVIVLSIMIVFRLRAATRERLDRRQEGVPMFVTLRLVAAAMWIGTIAFLIDPRWMAWSSVPLSARWRWLGLAPFAAGVALLVWTLRSLGPNLTDTVVTRRAHTLVTLGPYRWVRHPFYDTLALLVAGIALMAANWFILAGGAMVFVLLAARSHAEEANLEARFGEPYRGYRARTGRFLPRR